MVSDWIYFIIYRPYLLMDMDVSVKSVPGFERSWLECRVFDLCSVLIEYYKGIRIWACKYLSYVHD